MCDSRISIHHRYGSSLLNLTRTAALASGAEDAPLPTPVPSTGAGGEDKVDSDVGSTTSLRPTDAASAIGGGYANFVHAGLCILAFLIVIPSAALVRYTKATGSTATFTLHRNLQFREGVGAFFVFGSSHPLTWLIYSCTSISGGMFAYLSWTAMVPGQRTK